MFLECSNLISPNPATEILGFAVGEVSGDGRFSLVLAPRDDAPRILAWDGGALIDRTPPALAAAGPGARGLVIADMDGDGREEIYILCAEASPPPRSARSGRTDRIFACFGQRWIDLLTLPENAGAANRHGGHGLTAIDRHGQGRYAVAVTARHAPLRLYELDRRGRVRDVADGAALDVDTPAALVLAAPLSGPRPDLVVIPPDDGHTRLFRNTGDGSFAEMGPEGHTAPGMGPEPGPGPGMRPAMGDARAALVLDYDGTPHLLLADSGGPVRWLGPRAGGGFADIVPPRLEDGPGDGPGSDRTGRVRGVIAADFDNDGYEELLVIVEDGPNRLYAWRHEQWLRADIGDAERPWAPDTGAVVADIDADGQLEILVAGAGLPLALYLAAPNGNGWVRIIPLTAAGAPARGARVRLAAAGRVQTRCIDAGGSHGGCRVEPVAHFGLGDTRHIDFVEITWPDGRTRRLEDVAPRSVLSVPPPL